MTAKRDVMPVVSASSSICSCSGVLLAQTQAMPPAPGWNPEWKLKPSIISGFSSLRRGKRSSFADFPPAQLPGKPLGSGVSLDTARAGGKDGESSG